MYVLIRLRRQSIPDVLLLNGLLTTRLLLTQAVFHNGNLPVPAPPDPYVVVSDFLIVRMRSTVVPHLTYSIMRFAIIALEEILIAQHHSCEATFSIFQIELNRRVGSGTVRRRN